MSLHQLPKVIHVSIPLTKFRLLSFQTHHTQNSSGTLKAHKLSKEQKPDPKIKEPFERIPRMFKLPIRKTQKNKKLGPYCKMGYYPFGGGGPPFPGVLTPSGDAHMVPVPGNNCAFPSFSFCLRPALYFFISL